MIKTLDLARRITDYRGYNYNFYGRNFLTFGSVIVYALENISDLGLDRKEHNSINRMIKSSRDARIRLTIEQLGLLIVSTIHMEKEFCKVLIDGILRTRKAW